MYFSLLFTPEHQSTEFETKHSTLELPKLKSQSDQQQVVAMSKMRGWVADSLVEPQTKAKFDRATTTELEIRMQNICSAKREEIDWARHWKFSLHGKWNMEFLKKKQISWRKLAFDIPWGHYR
jgi:hypothetical protein